MRIVRFAIDRSTKYGVLEGSLIRGLKGSPFNQRHISDFLFDAQTYELDEVRLVAPCRPSKIVCLGLNYRKHAEETGLAIPEVPLIFLKPSTAVVGPNDTIKIPRDSRRTDYEGELGVVISRRAKDVPEDRVGNFILGYTCFNDISERHNQRDDGQWTRAKGYDTFAPIGPCIATGISPDDLQLETRLNGELRQSCRTSDLIFGIPRLVSFISGVMTLLPGDVIATGTPSGIGPINEGDIVEVRIDSIGALRNPVARRK